VKEAERPTPIMSALPMPKFVILRVVEVWADGDYRLSAMKPLARGGF